MSNWGYRDNPYKYGEDGWFEVEQHNIYVDRLNRQGGSQGLQPLHGYGEWAAGIGICFFLFGILASHGAHGIPAHLLIMGGYALLGVAIVTAVFAVLKGPVFLFRAIKWATRGNIFLRWVVFGALVGVALGAAIALLFGGHMATAMINFGVIGTVVGLVVGLLLSLVAKARRRSTPSA